jgi:nucleotide-binding universal stress UspA family protein
MYRRILLANRGTVEADGALEPSLVLARRFSAELHMLLIEELPRFPVSITEVVGEKREADRRCAFIVASAQRRAKEAQIKFRSHVVVGRFVERIVKFVNENQIDLLVIGLIESSLLDGCLFGDATLRLVRLTPCAVHVVK